KLPELARSLGASAKEFRKGIAEGSAEDHQSDAERDQSNVTRDWFLPPGRNFFPFREPCAGACRCRPVGQPVSDTPLSWEEVARTHGRKIYNFAYRLCGDPHDAADLVQEVLLRVRKGLADYQPGSFDGWLWRITHNAFIDEMRRRQRRPTAPLPEAVDRWDADAAPGADEQLAAMRLGDDIQAALLELPYEFREAVVMCDVIGLSYEEIAAAVAV